MSHPTGSNLRTSTPGDVERANDRRLIEASVVLHASDGPAEVMARAAALARDLYRAKAGCALWVGGPKDALAFATAGALPPGGEEFCRRVMLCAAPTTVETADGTWLAVPLRGPSAMAGAVAVWCPELTDSTLMGTLAELVASGARNADQVGRLRQRTRRGDEMLRHAAHEVRRPLSVLHADLELLEDDLPSPGPERDKVMARLRSAVDDMRDIAEDVLGYERLVAGVAPALPFELGEAVRKACAPHIDRVVSSGEEGVVVYGDPTLVVSAIRNLVDNAVKYSPAGRPVIVAWAAAGDFTAIEVQNEGPGIATSDQTRIFEPFTRLPQAKTTGIGLGLSLVRAVAEAHGGSVRVESEPGRGATFTFVLPRGLPIDDEPGDPGAAHVSGSKTAKADSPAPRRGRSDTAEGSSGEVEVQDSEHAPAGADDRRYVGAARPS